MVGEIVNLMKNQAELIQSEETGKNWKENQSLPYVGVDSERDNEIKKKKEYRLKFSQIWWKTVKIQ